MIFNTKTDFLRDVSSSILDYALPIIKCFLDRTLVKHTCINPKPRLVVFDRDSLQ
jgi:hypothetical protein